MSDRAKFWARLLGAWEKSGLSQAEFCRRRGVKAVTFAWWKRKLGGRTVPGHRLSHRSSTTGPRAAANGRRTSAKFAEVVWPSRVTTAGAAESVGRLATGYEIVLANGSLIRLPSDFDPEKASQLIDLAASRC